MELSELSKVFRAKVKFNDVLFEVIGYSLRDNWQRNIRCGLVSVCKRLENINCLSRRPLF